MSALMRRRGEERTGAPAGHSHWGARVAVVEGSPALRRVLARILRADGHEVIALGNPAALQAAALREAEAVLLDLDAACPRGAALDLRLRQPGHCATVVSTARSSVDGAVAALRRGAFDYLTKPFADLARVRAAMRAAVVHTRERRALETRGPLREGTLALRGAQRPRAEARLPLADAHLPLSLEAYERAALERALRESAGDAREAAHRLGIGRSTFYRKLARHGIRAGDAPLGLGGPRPIG